MNENTYYSLFDENGKIYSSFMQHINFETEDELNSIVNSAKEDALKDGIQLELYEITQDDWEYYTNNKGMGDNDTGYIRDKDTGKPISAPPLPDPTEEELIQEQLSELEQEYITQEKSFKNDLATAILANNQEAITSLQEEYNEFNLAYKEAKSELIGDE